MRRPVLAFCTALAFTVAVVGSVPSRLVGADDPSSLSEARQEREAARSERAEAARQLDAARAADAEVAEALAAVTELLNSRRMELDQARRRLAEARVVATEAQTRVEQSEAAIIALRTEIADQAVHGFLAASNIDFSDSMLSATDPVEAVRRANMLQLADRDGDDLLEELRATIEDRQVDEAVARDAVEEAEALEARIAALVVEVEAEQATQAALKAEMEARVTTWQEELAAAERTEAELVEFIRREEAKLVPPAPTAPSSGSPAPGQASGSGFQWPAAGRATSEFGYRVHPIFGTRRLHAGIDIAAPTGTPIVAAKDGIVLSAGRRGGYGNTVVISHGGGISTLYAHQSQMAVRSGQSVSRGALIGYVGSTGNSTGPHLHFEVRVNGGPTNPRGYLP